jgi:methylmalonyl-CoA mutase N-terminal domain/subunit
MEKRIWDMVLDIESKGDPAELVDRGWFKRFFEEIMARYASQVAEGELLKVGFNCHQIPDEEDTLLKEVAETKFEPCWDRSDKIKEYKQSRDRDRIKEMLQEIYHKAKTEGENLTNPIILGFEAGATMGEIAGALRLAYDWPYDPLGKTEPLI